MQCQTCSHQITKATGKTELSCGHVFHPRCIHNFYKGSHKCPKCPENEGPVLDFGDDPIISNSSREAIFAMIAPAKAKNALDFITQKLSFKSNYSPIATPDELVNKKAPISEFTNRAITARNLAETGITIDYWLVMGYTLRDLQTIGVTWDDFRMMGYGPKNMSKIPPNFLVHVLKIDISHLISMGMTLEDLIEARFTSRELLSLKCTTHTLISLGLDENHMKAFPFTNAEWNTLALQ